jgi:ABC-type sugar transport system ATPase subunit
LDEPTKGVDVGARQEIYRIIREVQQSGTSVIVVSSDLDELLALVDRVIVISDGTTVDEFERADGDESRILKYGTGVSK